MDGFLSEEESSMLEELGPVLDQMGFEFNTDFNSYDSNGDGVIASKECMNNFGS